MLIEEIKNINSDKKELNKFGKTIGVVLILTGAVLFFLGNKLFVYFGIGGMIFILAGLTSPVLLLPFHKTWMAIAVTLGFVSTRLILTLLFYFVMTPIKLFSKLFGKSFLDLKLEKNKKSYWNRREKKSYDPLETEKQF